nr:MAG TPA: EVH1 domain protein [Caudoviricetes sp.]
MKSEWRVTPCEAPGSPKLYEVIRLLDKDNPNPIHNIEGLGLVFETESEAQGFADKLNADTADLRRLGNTKRRR